MSKVKNGKKPKVSLRDILDKETPEVKCPSFSFSYLTKNKSYNFRHFEKVCNIRQEAEVYRQLDKLLLDLSINRWVDIICRDKEGFGGYESLTYDRLYFSPNNLPLSSDTKISVIRFGNDDAYRLIGYWKNPTLYILGYDFNHSAYDHGS